MLFKRTAFALAVAAALLAVAPAAPAASADPIVSAVTGYDWEYYVGYNSYFNTVVCFSVGVYLNYLAFCPTCYGAGIAGSAGCALAAMA